MICVRCGRTDGGYQHHLNDGVHDYHLTVSIQNLLCCTEVQQIVGDPRVIGKQQIAIQRMFTTHQARLCDECAKERLALELLGPVSPEATAKWIAEGSRK